MKWLTRNKPATVPPAPKHPPRAERVEELVIMRAEVRAPMVSVILPTFNEGGNIVELLRQIKLAMAPVGYTYECIFVDDSTDTTLEVIRRAAKAYPRHVTVVRRLGASARTGLTLAFYRGFQEARGRYVVCMDTDLQHPPAVIPELLSVLESQPGIDISIASRYTKGGSADGLSGRVRHFVSRMSTYVVWLFLPATQATTDPMTGFFAFRREMLSRVALNSSGFKILVELLVAMQSARSVDVPFVFQKRHSEESKASIKQGIKFFVDIIRLASDSRYGAVWLKQIVITILSVGMLMGLLWWGDKNNVAASQAFYQEWLVVVTTFFGALMYGSLIWHHRIQQAAAITQVVLIAGFTAVVSLLTLFIAFSPGTSVGYDLAIFATCLYAVAHIGQPVFTADWEAARQVERWFLYFVGGLFLLTMSYFIGIDVWWNVPLVLLYSVVIAQGLFSLYLKLYAWEDPSALAHIPTKDEFVEPHYSITAIVPCKHEKNTIADTLRAMQRIDYPVDKKQILVVIHEGTDDGTIGIVRETLAELGTPNMSLVTYNEEPINKPHGLNDALKQATGDFVVIFDAEDEPYPQLFRLVNTFLIQNPKIDVVQTGVQLMNYMSNWYSTFNVLEYYFWFKSSLHFFAKQQVMPLGGVSVFFRRSLVETVGGWDMHCLTEDAELGIRLSQAGAKMAVVYDAVYATREETPPSVMSFIKQRTRWAQGFLQILARGDFTRFPTLRQRLLALYVLSWPILIPFVFLLFPFGIIMMLTVALPPPLAVMANVSVLIFLMFIVTLSIGIYEFTREYGLKFYFSRIVVIVFLFYFYTVLLTIASLRGLYRNIRQVTVWEKTEHLNTHRATTALTHEPVPSQSAL